MTMPDGQQLNLGFDQSSFGEDALAMHADVDHSSAEVVNLATFRNSSRVAQQVSDDDKSIIQRALASVRLFS